jgi:hypothetical protein
VKSLSENERKIPKMMKHSSMEDELKEKYESYLSGRLEK